MALTTAKKAHALGSSDGSTLRWKPYSNLSLDLNLACWRSAVSPVVPARAGEVRGKDRRFYSTTQATPAKFSPQLLQKKKRWSERELEKWNPLHPRNITFMSCMNYLTDSWKDQTQQKNTKTGSVQTPSPKPMTMKCILCQEIFSTKMHRMHRIISNLLKVLIQYNCSDILG